MDITEGRVRLHKDIIVAMGIGGASWIDSSQAFLGVILELDHAAAELWMLGDELLEHVVDLAVGGDVVLLQADGEETPRSAGCAVTSFGVSIIASNFFLGGGISGGNPPNLRVNVLCSCWLDLGGEQGIILPPRHGVQVEEAVQPWLCFLKGASVAELHPHDGL